IDSPRSSDALDSPSTQRTASMMFDLPHPFGPTTPTSCPGTWKCVGSTKDLKPESLMEVRRTIQPFCVLDRARHDLERAFKGPYHTIPNRPFSPCLFGKNL